MYKNLKELNKLEVIFLATLIIPIGLTLPNLNLNLLTVILSPSSQYHNSLLPFAVFAMAILFVSRIFNLRLPMGRVDILIYAMFALFTISHVININNGSSNIHYIDNMLFLFFYILGHNIKITNLFKKIILFSAGICCLIYFIFIILIPRDVFSSIVIIGMNINEYRNLVPIIIYSIFYLSYLDTTPGSNLYKYIVFFLIFSFAFLSWSRTGLAFLGLVPLIALTFIPTSTRTKIGLTAIIITIFLIFVTPFMSFNTNSETTNSETTNSETTNSETIFSENIFVMKRISTSGGAGDFKRLDLLVEGWTRMVNGPLFGNGFITDNPIEQGRYGDGNIRYGAFASHNQFVDVGIKTGLIGFFLFIFLNIAIVVKLIRSPTKYVAIFGTIWLAAMGASFAQNVFLNYSGYFLWTMAGACIALNRDNRISASIKAQS